MADPGTGNVRLNNATLASVTQIAVSALSASSGNPDVSDYITVWDDSTSSVKGYLLIRESGAPATILVFSITGTITDNTTWLQIPVTHVSSSGSLGASDDLYVSFSRSGDTPTNALLASNNLSDLDNTGTARTALGLTDPAADAYASQGEAEAGTSAVVVMNPLRTAQAITALASGNESLLLGGVFSLNPWQRGVSFTSATTFLNNDAAYLADQWFLLSDGNDIVDVTQDTDGSLKADVETGNKQFGFAQIVRASNATRVMGDVISAAVRVKASAGLTTLRMAVLTWDGTADACTRDLVGTWAGGGSEPTWAANWTREGTVTDITLSTSYATAKVENVSLDTASGKQFAIVVWLDDTTTDVSDTLNIEWISAVPGATHTDTPPVRLAAQERLLCRSEFRLLANGNAKPVGIGYQVDGTTGFLVFDISMAEVPVMSVSNASHFTFYPDSVAATAMTVYSGSTTECFLINITVASGFAANDCGALQSNSASALLYLTTEI
jgi:hypothetical protein